MRNKTTKETAPQPPCNGGCCLPVDIGLLGTYEKRIIKIKANLTCLEHNKDGWELSEVFFLRRYYTRLLKKYRMLMNESHSGLVDEIISESL